MSGMSSGSATGHPRIVFVPTFLKSLYIEEVCLRSNSIGLSASFHPVSGRVSKTNGSDRETGILVRVRESNTAETCSLRCARLVSFDSLLSDVRLLASARRQKVRVRESNQREKFLLTSLRGLPLPGFNSRWISAARQHARGRKSGCENRTRVSASTRLKDNHYPNPDTHPSLHASRIK